MGNNAGTGQRECATQISSTKNKMNKAKNVIPLLGNPLGVCYVREETCVGEASEMDFRSSSPTFLSQITHILKPRGSAAVPGLPRLQTDTRTRSSCGCTHSAAVTPTEMQLHTGRHLESAQMARPLPCSSPCCRSSALSSRDTSSAACPAAHKSRPCTLGK